MASAKSAGSKKTECPLTHAEFHAKAPASIVVTINGQNYVATRKAFSTGSYGYYLSDKIVMDIGGTPLKIQIGLNMAAVGSKEADRTRSDF